MKKPLHLLLYEGDARYDSTLMGAIKHFSWVEKCEVVTNEEAYLEALSSFKPHAILFATKDTIASCTHAVAIARKHYHEIPFLIIVSNDMEDMAQQVIDSGANDYLHRDNLSHLPIVLKSALLLQKSDKDKQSLTKSLKQAKNNYDTVFLKGSLPKWIYEIETLRFLEVNEAAVAKYGYSREEFLQMTLKDIRPNEEIPLLEHYFETHPTPKGTLKEQWHHRTKSGDIITVDTIAHTVLFENRKARLVTLLDVTEIHRAQQKVIESQAYLQIIFDNTSDGFLLLDEKANIVIFNHRAELYSLIKKSKPFEVGQPIYDFIEKTSIEPLKEIVALALKGKKSTYDRSYPREDGSTTWIEYIAIPVYIKNEIKGVCITGRNITGKKLLEQQKEFDRNNLKALINNTTDYMWSIDLDYKIITCNDAFNRAFKAMTGKDALPGTKVTDSNLNPESLKHFKEFYQRAFHGESYTVTRYQEIPYMYWADVSFYPIYNNYEVIGAAVFARDVANRIKAEKEHHDYTLSLEEMLFNISHKLRVPIANLMGLGNIAESSNNSAEELKSIMGYIKPTITVLDEFARDLTRFIEQILIANKSEVLRKDNAKAKRTKKE